MKTLYFFGVNRNSPIERVVGPALDVLRAAGCKGTQLVRCDDGTEIDGMDKYYVKGCECEAVPKSA